MTELFNSIREKSKVFVDLAGLLLGFLVISVTSDNPNNIINSSITLKLIFCAAAVSLASSMTCGLLVYSNSSINWSVFNDESLMVCSLLLLIFGLFLLLWLIFFIVLGNEIYSLFMVAILGLFTTFLIVHFVSRM